MSSTARKLLPAEVLTHPAVVSLIERGTPTGTLTPEEVRQASEDAAVEPRHLKALLGHLSALGISVVVPAAPARAVAATSTRKTTTAKAAKAPVDTDTAKAAKAPVDTDTAKAAKAPADTDSTAKAAKAPPAPASAPVEEPPVEAPRRTKRGAKG